MLTILSLSKEGREEGSEGDDDKNSPEAARKKRTSIRS